MNSIMMIAGIVFLFLLLLYGDVVFGIRCPICKSTKHWENFNAKSKRYFDDLCCHQCQRAIYITKTGTFKTFEQPQCWNEE